jgi:hypothetical protein
MEDTKLTKFVILILLRGFINAIVFLETWHRWEDGIKMDLRETGWEGVEWIHLTQYRDWRQAAVNAMMILQVLVPRSQSW